MRFLTMLACTFLLLAFPFTTFAQPEPTPSENGAVFVALHSGWSFGVPAVRAAVSVPGVGSATSPEKKTLVAPSFTAGVRAWKFLVPFFDFTYYDTGKATATVGSFSSQVEAETFSYTGGVRLVGRKSKVRGYVELGGGALHQNLKGTFYVAGRPTPATGSASIGTFMYGAGVQLFAGRKWGSDIGFDGFRIAEPFVGGGQSFSRVRIGIFYQTKSALP